MVAVLLKSLRVGVPLCLQVSKLVMELDTSYRWSEQQLTPAQQENSRQAVDTSQHAELIKDAKRLPELRVRGDV